MFLVSIFERLCFIVFDCFLGWIIVLGWVWVEIIVVGGGVFFVFMEFLGIVDLELYLLIVVDLVLGWFVVEGDDKIGKEFIWFVIERGGRLKNDKEKKGCGWNFCNWFWISFLFKYK